MEASQESEKKIEREEKRKYKMIERKVREKLSEVKKRKFPGPESYTGSESGIQDNLPRVMKAMIVLEKFCRKISLSRVFYSGIESDRDSMQFKDGYEGSESNDCHGGDKLSHDKFLCCGSSCSDRVSTYIQVYIYNSCIFGLRQLINNIASWITRLTSGG